MSCASGAAPRRLSVLLFLLPFGSEALGSASFSSASSSDYSSDGDLGSCSGNEEAFDAPKALHEMNKEGKKPELLGDCIEELKAIVQLSESKLTIEKLLMQETFSRFSIGKFFLEKARTIVGECT